MTRSMRAEFAASASRAVLPLVVTPSENCASFGMAFAVPVPFTVMPCSGELSAPPAVSGMPTPATAAAASTSRAKPAIRIIFIVAS